MKMRLCLCILLVAIAFEATSLPVQPVAGDQEAEASADQVSASASEGQSKSPRLIKRIIRVRESEPPQAGQESVSGEPGPSASNGGISNNVDVKPEISVQVPNAQGGPQASNDGDLPQNMRSNNKKLNKVLYKPRHRHSSPPSSNGQEPSSGHHAQPIIEEPAEEEPRNVGSGNPEELQISPYPVPQTQPVGSHGVNMMGNSNNHRNTLLHNVGNTESVHIDGVGNNKVTRITNSGNNSMQDATPAGENGANQHHHHHPHDKCEHANEDHPKPTMVKSSGLATGGAPLVQVNIREQAGPVRQAEASPYLVPILNDSALIDVSSAKLIPKSDLSKLVSGQSNHPGDGKPQPPSWLSEPNKQYMLIHQQSTPFGAANRQQPIQMGPVYQFPGQPMMMPPAYPMWPMWPVWPPYPMPPYAMSPYPMGPPPSFFHEPSFFDGPHRRRRHRKRRNNRKDMKEDERKRKPEPEGPSDMPIPVPPSAPEPKPEPELVPQPETSTEPTTATTTSKPNLASRFDQLKSWLPEISIRETPGEPARKDKEAVEWETIRVPKVKKDE